MNFLQQQINNVYFQSIKTQPKKFLSAPLTKYLFNYVSTNSLSNVHLLIYSVYFFNNLNSWDRILFSDAVFLNAGYVQCFCTH